MLSVSSFELPNYQYDGTTAKLRMYSNKDWTDEDGIYHPKGMPGNPTGFFQETNASIVSGTFINPAFVTPPTLTAIRNPSVRISWQIWSEDGVPREVITGSGGWQFPASPTSTTRNLLEIYNQGVSLTNPPATYLSISGVQTLIDAQVGLLSGYLPRQTGLAILSGGTVTVLTAEVLSNSKILVVGQDDDVSGSCRAVNRVAGTSFDIVSSNGADSGVAAWFLY